ncbi:hypothetical protein HHK36_022477 [Tetracentron sinense]|uniref:Mitochondrial import receptor subunit TOM22 homolog n=1 Tax=Tetracentron sinense TaxID=13715 RepID=A0A834YPW9_TETSI|nr:hypothetical protein HHK36_022477 [Tetracentron sinense]
MKEALNNIVQVRKENQDAYEDNNPFDPSMSQFEGDVEEDVDEVEKIPQTRLPNRGISINEGCSTGRKKIKENMQGKGKEKTQDGRLGIDAYFAPLNSFYFQPMVDAITEIGSGYKVPSYHNMRTHILQQNNFEGGKGGKVLGKGGAERHMKISMVLNNVTCTAQNSKPVSPMASQGRRGISLPGTSSNANEGILAKVSNTISQLPILYQGKRAASNSSFVAKKLLKSTGKAAWIVGTTFLILVVPLIIEMDRDQQMTDLELQQASLLGTPPVLPQN